MDVPILSPMIIDLVDDDRAETPALLDEPASLLMRLWSASKAIPTSVPYGAPGDALTQFSGDPIREVPGGNPDAVWEYINKTMDRVLGYGISAEELSKLVHQGLLGMGGLCDWMETCIKKLRIKPILLKGHILRLIDATKLLVCVYLTIILST